MTANLPPRLLPYLGGEWAMEPMAHARLMQRLLSLPRAQWDEADDMPEPAKPAKKPYEVTGGTAVVPLCGTLQKREDWLTRWFPEDFCATETFARTLAQAAADPEVTSVVLAVDSPGGLVDGVSEAAEAVYALRQGGKKPLLAVVSGMCCSAAYWIAAQAGEVWAGETDMVGSIGTRLRLLDTSAFYEMLGVVPIEVTTGTFKAAGADGLPITPEQIGYFQGIADRTQERFTAAVARGRKLPIDDVRGLAKEARVYVGRDAQAAGLIDGIGTFAERLGALAKGSSSGRQGAHAVPPASGGEGSGAEPDSPPEVEPMSEATQQPGATTAAPPPAAPPPAAATIPVTAEEWERMQTTLTRQNEALAAMQEQLAARDAQQNRAALEARLAALRVGDGEKQRLALAPATRAGLVEALAAVPAESREAVLAALEGQRFVELGERGFSPPEAAGDAPQLSEADRHVIRVEAERSGRPIADVEKGFLEAKAVQAARRQVTMIGGRA